ncbi:MAG: DUF4355 domain-containing protein [Endomicrobium sp.]|jgi:DNA-binding transcriptional ArsR family regulator|nr:DUF4355 domain-containing protein [Endomicrobium sp.]
MSIGGHIFTVVLTLSTAGISLSVAIFLLSVTLLGDALIYADENSKLELKSIEDEKIKRQKELDRILEKIESLSKENKTDSLIYEMKKLRKLESEEKVKIMKLERKRKYKKIEPLKLTIGYVVVIPAFLFLFVIICAFLISFLDISVYNPSFVICFVLCIVFSGCAVSMLYKTLKYVQQVSFAGIEKSKRKDIEAALFKRI